MKILLNGLEYQKEEFKKKCKHFAEEVKSYGEQNRFLKSCRKAILGDGSYRQWKADEIAWKLEIMKIYFPNETKALIEYVENEKILREQKRQIREQKNKMLELRDKSL